MKINSSKNTIIALVVVATGFIIITLNKYGPRYTNKYEKANGYVYNCTQRIWVKYQSAEPNGKPGLTPFSPSEANKYCQILGIE